MAQEARNVVDRIDLHFRGHLIAAGQYQAALCPEVDLAASRGIAAHGVGFANRAVHGEAREYPHGVLQVGRLAVVFQREPAARGHHQRRAL